MVVNNRSKAIENIYDLRKENDKLRENNDIIEWKLSLETSQKTMYKELSLLHEKSYNTINTRYGLLLIKLKDEELRYGRYRKLLFQIYILTILTIIFIHVIL